MNEQFIKITKVTVTIKVTKKYVPFVDNFCNFAIEHIM